MRHVQSVTLAATVVLTSFSSVFAVQNPFTPRGVRSPWIEDRRPQTMTRTRTRLALLGLMAALGASACTPTVRLQVDPIQIYAKLDADVRVRLDKELQDLLVENPNLF